MASLQKRVVKGKEYWSIVESKRINGKPRPIVIDYIGNTKKLYERIQNNSVKNCTLKSFSHGDTQALLTIASKLEIEQILDRFLGKHSACGIKSSTSILLAAIHRACKPGSKNQFADWFRTTSLPDILNIRPENMTSQHFWQQMDGISKEALAQAEDAITQKILNTYHVSIDKLALDYTNYFTYIGTENNRNHLAQRGRNKQKRHDLRQCSLAVVTSKEAGIPLFSHVYEGNKNDQTAFQEYLKALEQRMPGYSPEDVTLIFDSGSNTKKNLEMLKCHYICSFSLSCCKELYDININSYQDIEINGRMRKCYRTERNIWGKERNCILSYSHKLFNGQVRDMNEQIKKAINGLDDINVKIDNKRSRLDKTESGINKQIDKVVKGKYLKEIIHTKIKNGKIVYEIDEQKKQEIIEQYFGKKLTITDRGDWETAEILGAYYEQDYIEKIFRDTKNVDHFSISPIYHWTDQKIRVHIFICLLGLILTAVLQKEMQGKGIQLSKNELMEKLAQIRQCWVKENNSNKVTKVLEEMDSTQSQIWNAVSTIE